MVYWASNAHEAWKNVQHKLFFSPENDIWNLPREAELVPTWSPAGEKIHAKGRLEESVVVGKDIIATQLGFRYILKLCGQSAVEGPTR